MPTLIENILSLEAQASDAVAKAHAEAETIAKRAENDIAGARAKLAAETDAQLGALEKTSEERCQRELAEAEAQSQKDCAAIDGLSASVVQRHATAIAAEFTKG